MHDGVYAPGQGKLLVGQRFLNYLGLTGGQPLARAGQRVNLFPDSLQRGGLVPAFLLQCGPERSQVLTQRGRCRLLEVLSLAAGKNNDIRNLVDCEIKGNFDSYARVFFDTLKKSCIRSRPKVETVTGKLEDVRDKVRGKVEYVRGSAKKGIGPSDLKGLYPSWEPNGEPQAIAGWISTLIANVLVTDPDHVKFCAKLDDVCDT